MENIEFINKAKKIHGNRYDYSLVDYKSAKTKVKIICKKHGIFEQTPTNHLSKRGCPECGKEERSNKKRLEKVKFDEKIQFYFGDKYEYSFSDYKNNHTKMKFICKEHGEFWQSPIHLLEGQTGCLKCSKEKFRISRSFTNEQFIEKAKEKFPEYDYSITKYISSQSRVKYICKKHGINEIIASSLLNGFGCKKCGIENSKETKKKYKF